MRISFGNTPVYTHTRHQAQSTPSVATATPTSKTTGTDFRDSLPSLAFSGIFSRGSKTPEMDAAHQYVLNRKIEALTEPLQEQLMARGKARLHVPAYGGGSPLLMNPEGQKELSATLAKQALGLKNYSHLKSPLLTKENNILAAQYAVLLLLSSKPDFIDKIGLTIRNPLKLNSRPPFYLEDRHGQDAQELYRQIAEAAQHVQSWLTSMETQEKCADIQDSLYRLNPLAADKRELEQKSAPETDEDVNAWLNLEEATSPLQEQLDRLMSEIGEPELPEPPTHPPDDLESALAEAAEEEHGQN